MKITDLHEDLKKRYKNYIKSFINISDERINKKAEETLQGDDFWPETLIQFNPNYLSGKSVEDMIAEGLPVSEDLKNFFINPFYLHQQKAVELGCQGKEFVVTSGTGSGKSRTFMATIFNHILLHPESCKDKTIAIIVYPMNALINSQYEELEKYKVQYEAVTGKACPFTFGKYTGQENQDQRKEMQQTPPNIILTNYMMLELLMTRSGDEQKLRDCFLENLQFLVFDELHTYRGRQGSDVSLLIRRIKAQSKRKVLCFGTSATMVSDDNLSYKDSQQKVADVASCIFGSDFSAEQVIDETLTTSLADLTITKEALTKCVLDGAPVEGTDADFAIYPLAIWLERNIALNFKEGKFFRGKPLSTTDMAKELASATDDCDEALCKERIEELLEWCNIVNKERGDNAKPYLPYKIHQFISQTGNIYATLGAPNDRHITTKDELYCEEVSDEGNPVFYYPVVFSRLSGHEFYVVSLDEIHQQIQPRQFDGFSSEVEDDILKGYIFVAHEGETTDDFELDAASDEIPLEWLNSTRTDVKKDVKEKILPKRIFFSKEGSYSFDELYKDNFDVQGWFVPFPMRYDPTSGVIYHTSKREWAKLAKIGGEGRSTATTILSYETVNIMKEQGVEDADSKLMTFVDARQDAALQAGHFNDFIRVGKVRSAIYKGLSDLPYGTPINSTEISSKVLANLGLAVDDYSKTKGLRGKAAGDVQKTMKRYLLSLIYTDLGDNWAVIMPNLEQCALVDIRYKYLHDEVFGFSEDLEPCERLYDLPEFEGLDDGEKYEFIIQILDFFRHNLCMEEEDHMGSKPEELAKDIRNSLCEPWTLNDGEEIQQAHGLYLARETSKNRNTLGVSGGYQSKLAKYVKDVWARKDIEKFTDDESYVEYMTQVFEVLNSYLVQDIKGRWRLKFSMIEWYKGDLTGVRMDRTSMRSTKDVVLKPNQYFQSFYSGMDVTDKRISAKDHTGQVDKDERAKREEEFREGKLPIIYCSPTMELGIDIKNLSVVGLRNVPPTPANYTQRAGRAGRSGQTALIFTYCRTNNPHENHYFNHPEEMVAGKVTASRMDLLNEELFSTHLHSIILSKHPIPQLSDKISDIVDYSNIDNIQIKETVKPFLQLNEAKRSAIKVLFKKMIADAYLQGRINEAKPYWFTEQWIDDKLNNYVSDFDHALDRWRSLYRAAQLQIDHATEIIRNRVYGDDSLEKKLAHNEQRRGEAQRDLLLGKDIGNNCKELNEFYPYRYLASEGFLPGYNFTRLPIRALLQEKNDNVEYVSRAKSLALREFGPKNIVYHDGKKYQINRMLLDSNFAFYTFKFNPGTGMIFKVSERSAEDNTELANQVCKNDVFTGEDLDVVAQPVPGTCVKLTDMSAIESDRITCQEEERFRAKFKISTYFSSDMPGEVSQCEIKADGKHLATLRYIPSCRITYIMEPTSEDSTGFLIDTATGYWKSKKEVEEARKKAQQEGSGRSTDIDRYRSVKIFSDINANALYLQPMAALNMKDEQSVRTFMYAIKQAIEEVFQVESGEIGVDIMGNPECPNLFVYENSEGSLGILSRLVKEKSCYTDVIKKAYSLCFEKDTYTDSELNELIPASYDDLLNYYNQPYHKLIDRRVIYQPLKLMMSAEIELKVAGQQLSYDSMYLKLQQERDQSSSTEDQFLKYLYKHKLRLPDEAQPKFQKKDLYIMPDFRYDKRTFIFCDGTPHDLPEVKADDEIKRKAMEDRGYKVLVWYYKDSLEDFVNAHKDLFTEVK